MLLLRALAPARRAAARALAAAPRRALSADLSEDAYETPDAAPPSRRSRRSMDVATSITASVQADKASSEDVAQLKHTLAVLVDNESGVLSRVSGLLSARGFNIESLTVSPTNLPEMSRMTIVIRGITPAKAAQALKQLDDLVNVWGAVDYTGTNSLQRELVMVKVGVMPGAGGSAAERAAAAAARPTYAELLAAQSHRAAVRDLGALFGAETVDVGSRHIIFQLTSWSRRVDAFVKMLEPWGVIEVARSGVVAMLRSPVAGSLALAERKKEDVDVSALPPG